MICDGRLFALPWPSREWVLKCDATSVRMDTRYWDVVGIFHAWVRSIRYLVYMYRAQAIPVFALSLGLEEWDTI